MKISGMEKNIMRTMVPRGLAAAVLAQFPVAYGIKGAEAFSEIVFVVLLATIIYTSIATKFLQGGEEVHVKEGHETEEAPAEEYHKKKKGRKKKTNA